MKNLFKNLMLVAVAAMAFTACEKDIVNGGEEQNNQTATGEGATRITFVADFADVTRSGFVAKEEGASAYKSEWHADDKALFTSRHEGTQQIYSYYYYDYTYVPAWYVNGDSPVESTISADNTFDVSFEDQVYYGDELVAYAPAASWKVTANVSYTYDYDHYASIGNEYWDAYYKIPEPQNPTATSVDPLAHILKAEAIYYGVEPTLVFEHQVAYGRMQLKNFSEAIENVMVTVDSKTYTLNAADVVDNIFWFSCEANEAPTAVKVVVNTADKGYTKELDLTKGNGNGLSFIKGQVSAFGVDMSTAEEGEVVEPGQVGSSFDPDYRITSITPAGLSTSYGYKWDITTDGGNDTSFQITTPYAQGAKFEAGTYYFAGNAGFSGTTPFNFGVRLYSPFTFVDGTMEVFVNGDEYTINLTIDDSGSTGVKYQYVGAIASNY